MRRSTTLRAAFAILAIAFFAAPIALRGVGVTATAFENRRLAEPPRASQGWDAFQQAARFLTDRMPLREQAVRANTELWQTFFGTAPRYGASGDGGALPFAGQVEDATRAAGAPKPGGQASQVLEGRDGWLFLRLELKRACTPPMPFRQALERWALLLSIVRTYGRRAILVVPPDKGSIYGEYLPGGELAECARRSKPRLWHLLARERRGSGVIGLERALVRERRRRGDLVYSKRDSHWTGVGALEMVRSVLDRLGGRVRLKAGEVVRLGEDRYIGDLTVLRGEPTMDTRPAVSIRRAAGARRVPGRTLFVGDSFGEGALPYLKPYFSDLRELAWEDSTRAQLELEIERADTVIFESVEREFAFRTSDRGSLSKDFLERLRRRLGSDP